MVVGQLYGNLATFGQGSQGRIACTNATEPAQKTRPEDCVGFLLSSREGSSYAGLVPGVFYQERKQYMEMLKAICGALLFVALAYPIAWLFIQIVKEIYL